ncbi:hypothetical protein MKW92_053443 [Papaver armeniacum]|nr:hypothetical protein MKW92_053443 [Papaver armeniacum]
MVKEESPRVTKRATRSSLNTPQSPLLEEMRKEETPQSSKRTTRSSALKSCSSRTHETQKKIDFRSPSLLKDLVYREEPISFDALCSSFPGRRVQILELLQLLGPMNSPLLPLFIYGGASTGKTSVILQIFRHLKRPFIYSSCHTCYCPRVLFETVLNQLPHRRNSGSVKRCEKPADFVNLLQDGMSEFINNLKGNSSKLDSEELKEQGSTGTMIYFIFDNMELVRRWPKYLEITSMLFKLYEILKMAEVGFIFISNSSLDTYHVNTGFAEPMPVLFPDYREEDLRKIFLRNQPNQKLYSSFLDVVFNSFYRMTKRVDELSIAFAPLFQKYCELLSDKKGSVSSEDKKRSLFNRFREHIAPALNEIFKVPSHPNSFKIEAIKEKVKRRDAEVTDDIEFHMPISAKYLLISAFIASRNPATLDAALFDSTGGGDNRKRKRKMSETSKEKKELAEQELIMKGPGTFPLERLLAIFQCISSVAEFSLENEQQVEDEIVSGGDTGIMSDVLLQLSTLCNANYIGKGGSCPLEGSTRYRSTISEEMTLKVARSVNFPLSKYLYRR